MEAGPNDVFVVRSWRGAGTYLVSLEGPSCTCPAFEHRPGECKHIKAVRAAPERYPRQEEPE